jgi:hypothetical protein
MNEILTNNRRRFRNLRPVRLSAALGARSFRNYISAGTLTLLWMITVAALSASPEYQQPPAVPAVIHPTQERHPDEEPIAPLTAKQKQDLLKSNFEKLKRDAGDLAALVKSLQEEIDHSNENVLSLKVLEKAERIEKLAKKIKSAAKGE